MATPMSVEKHALALQNKEIRREFQGFKTNHTYS